MINIKKSKIELIEEITQLRQQIKAQKNESTEISNSVMSKRNPEGEAYKTLIDAMNDSVLVIDFNGKIIDVNDTAVKILKYSRKELLTMSPEDIDSFLSHDDIWKLIEEMKTEKRQVFETEHKTKDGERIPVEVSSSPVSYQGQACILSIARDITDRKQAEYDNTESENKYRTLFEQSADAILIIERDKFVDCNMATVKMLGYNTKKELLETHPSQLSPERQPDGKLSFTKANEMMSIAFEQGSHRFEWNHLRQNGEVFPVEVLLTAVPYRETQFLHTVWRDITDRKRLEELESRAARLEMAGTIAGQVAHDFNNLLGPIMAYPDLIRDELPDNHPALAYLDDIENSAINISEINQQLLTLSRRGHYNQEVINLNAIVKKVVREMTPLGDNVNCDIMLAPDLINIIGGGSQIHRVITNLLYNALESLQDSGRIIIKTENYRADAVSGTFGRVPKGDYVKLTISDTGSGISPENVQKILDPFFTTKTSNRERGSGLGLSVIHTVVKDHNGYLDLETKPGQGTSFYIYFPTTEKSIITNQAGDIAVGSESILVVDDDDVQRDVSVKLLKKLGYKVTSVESGEKAVKFLEQNPHDLVILDMVMPSGIDGAETYRQILHFNPNQKAIIVSGFSESGRVLVAQGLGAGAFVKKPLTKQAVSIAVRQELDKKELVAKG